MKGFDFFCVAIVSKRAKHTMQGNGIRGPSLLERLLEEYEATGVIDHEYELNAKNATAVIYVGELGLDSSFPRIQLMFH